MELVTTPEPLVCSLCGDAIREAVYVPATERDGEHEPKADAAVCDGCGFNEVGMMGCAPTLDDVTDPGPDDVLLYGTVTDEGFQVVSVKE